MPKLRLQTATVVIDAGAGELKYGYPSEQKPRVITPVVGQNPQDPSKFFAGEELQKHKDVITLAPIVKRRIVDWGAMEQLWAYTINTLLGITNGKDQTIILSEPSFATLTDRNKTLEIMFEKFGFEAVHIAKASELALAAAEQLTGLVIDAGEELTQVVPVRFGRAMTDSLQTLTIGGKDITLLVQKEINQQSKANAGHITFDTFKRIKEETCTVALDYEKESRKKTSSKKTYYTKDKKTFKFETKDLIRCTEPLFRPALLDKNKEKGLTDMITAALNSCEKEVQVSMYEAIVLAGGSGQFLGMRERLSKDLIASQSKHQYIKPRFPSLRTRFANHAAWKGAALLATHIDPEKLFMVKQDFLEHGRATGPLKE